MNNPCPIRVQCGDYPFVNLSSEGPEPFWLPPRSQYWTAIGYCCDTTLKQAFSTLSQANANNDLAAMLANDCPNCDDPQKFCATATCPDGSTLTEVCVPTSQADANTLANAMVPSCGDPNLFTASCACPDGSNAHTVSSPDSEAAAEALCAAIPKGCVKVGNSLQCCAVLCPDGSEFVYCVAAGTVYGDTVAQANAIANANACALAQANKTCMGALAPVSFCQNSSALCLVSVTGQGVYSWSVVSGALPDGMHIASVNAKTAMISGTPTTAGAFTFTLRATNTSGSYMQKSFTVHVVGFSTASPLPDAATGTPYSESVQATGGSGNYAYSVSAGALPTGLSMDAAGHITGAPTTPGVYTFTVLVQDSAL